MPYGCQIFNYTDENLTEKIISHTWLVPSADAIEDNVNSNNEINCNDNSNNDDNCDNDDGANCDNNNNNSNVMPNWL